MVVPSPVAPTNATPVWTARSYWNGHQRRAGLCCPLGQVDCCCYRYCWVVRPADSAEEQPDDLIAYDFVDDAVMGNDPNSMPVDRTG
jgi:hypothetical protein